MRRLLLAALLLAGCGDSDGSSGDAGAGDGPEPGAVDADAGSQVRPESLLVLAPQTATFEARLQISTTPRRFTLANLGDQATGAPQVSLGGAHGADFVIASSDCTTSVAPGGTCSIEVAFKPQTVGSKSAILLVAAQPGGMAVASLQGQAAMVEPFDFVPRTADFGMVMVGTTSAAALWVIPNSGSGALSVATVMVAGADFVLVADTCGGATLLPGEKCMFQVVFRPATAGVKSGSVMVDAGGPGGKATASLTGTGF
jgi:hypothetical protein